MQELPPPMKAMLLLNWNPPKLGWLTLMLAVLLLASAVGAGAGAGATLVVALTVAAFVAAGNAVCVGLDVMTLAGLSTGCSRRRAARCMFAACVPTNSMLAAW